MKTLLRHLGTGLYLECPGRWTENTDQAYDFRFADHAIRYVDTWDIKQVELAFAFDEPQCVVGAPLDTGERCAA